MMKKETLELKDYLYVSLICVLFGIFYLLAVYAGVAFTAFLTPMGFGMLGYEPFYGIWFMAPIFTLYALKKPGLGIITEVIAALIEVLLGNMFGIMVLVSGLIQGIGVELGFALTGYRQEVTYKTTCLGAIFATLLSFLWTGYRNQYWLLDLRLVLTIFFIRLISALLFTGIISKWLCDRLSTTGLLPNSDKD